MLQLIDLDDKQFEIYQRALEEYTEFVSMYLAKNNITNFNKYLYPTLKDLESPLLIKDAKKGMDYFINHYEDFCLVGDYDTDGITASAIVYLFMKEKYGYEIPVYIPERKEGYGLSIQSIDYAISIGKKAIITVDNGIAAFPAVDYAKEKGLFILVTDHHEIQAQGLPNADIIINTKREDSLYTDRQLSGAACIWNCLRIIDEKLVFKYLPLTLLGTIADVVELKDQNRIISKYGSNLMLEDIEVKSIRKLLQHLKKDRLERELIEYKISPMINASGRMDNAMKAFQFFIETDDNKIDEYIEYLENTNESRKIEQKKLEPFIMESIDPNTKFNLIFPPENVDYPSSLVGIMAGKVTEETNKPTIVLYKKVKDGKIYYGGSGRTPSYFDFKPFIEKLKELDLIVGGGGHKAAIGLTFSEDKKQDMINFIKDYTKNLKFQKPITEVYNIFRFKQDKKDNEKLFKSIISDLDMLEPFGNKNPIPKIAFKYKNATNFNLLKGEHLKFSVNGINILSFFNKHKINNNKGILIGMPSLNIWESKQGKVYKNYQILLQDYLKD